MDSLHTLRIENFGLLRAFKILSTLVILLGCVGCGTGRCLPGQNNSEKIEISGKETNTVLPEKIRIFKFDGTKQCGQGQLIPIADMEKELQGIEVFSRSAKNDGQMRIQMCGAPSGNANTFEIRKEDLEKAKKAGFREWIFE